jgi:hypothetical protein
VDYVLMGFVDVLQDFAEVLYSPLEEELSALYCP